ncbi:hypothetical protein LIER_19900 [Lithospermum erythrorhizon]|uniref:Uncharacterized protein n=1 Tax=Lithospermum erythrorhizon TaxID=34254 RepID=A0AAV3QN57_LITER
MNSAIQRQDLFCCTMRHYRPQLLIFLWPQRVEFPMPSNDFSSSFAKRDWDLLDDKGVHHQLFSFDKVYKLARILRI